MIWLRLVWYVFWRGLLYGGMAGILFGTLVSPFDGTIYGMVIGTFLGAILGLVNGITVTLVMRLFFNPPLNRRRYQRWIMIVTIPVDLIAALVAGALIGVLGIVAALITATILYFLIFGFVDYSITQLTQRPSHQPPANLQISN